MTRQEIKARAKAQLGGNIFGSPWLLALVVCLIASAVSLLNTIPMIGSIAVLVVTGPIAYGMAYCFLKQTRDGEPMNIGDVFKGFSDDFTGTLLIGLMTSVFTVLWSILFVIPGIVKTYSYSMAYYIKADHPEYKWNECITASRQLMNGHKMDLFIQDLSFIGWMFVGSLCLGVGTLWVAPYMEAARSQFYESLKVAVAAEQPTAESVNA
jgi:uncharacterized membrane protein